MRVSVICIGNELMLDDGVGPAVARYIASRYDLPPEVSVLDRACMGMAILSDLRACDFALVLDAIDVPGETPGRLFAFDPHDAAPTPPGATSLHDMRFADVVDSAQMLGMDVRGHCMGVQVENRSPSEFVCALTPRVAAALPLLAQAAMRYLDRELGVEVRDALKETDPLRAGCAHKGARDFSRQGVRAEGDIVTSIEGQGARRAVLPEVYGEPDTTVIAEYLASSLKAVGAAGRLAQMDALPGRTTVSFVVPSEATAALVETFGVEVLDGTGEENPRLVAYVGPQTTDYDCDALIEACLAAVERGDRDHG